MAGSIRIRETGEFFTFDSTLDEKLDKSATVSEHPIESELFVTDHRQDNADVLSVTVRVTESPLNRQVTDAGLEIPDLGMNEAANTSEGGAARITDADEFLESAKNKLVDWVAPRYGLREKLMISSITKVVETPLHVDYAIDLQEVRIATSQAVELPPEAVPKPSNRGKQDAGKQGKTKADPDTADPDRVSVMKGIGDDAAKGAGYDDQVDFLKAYEDKL